MQAPLSGGWGEVHFAPNPTLPATEQWVGELLRELDLRQAGGMGHYKLNEAGEWVRIEAAPKPPAEPEQSMADYIREAHETSSPSVEEERHEWKMKGALPPRKVQEKEGPRGGRYTDARTKDGRPYRRYF